jgi:hypothetical protein
MTSNSPRHRLPAAPEGASADPHVRERLLRELLFDARDELVRRRIESGATHHATGDETVPRDLPHDPPGYHELRLRLRAILRAKVPRGASVVIASRGDRRLLDIALDVSARHFPSQDDGEYAGHHPADSAEAIAGVEAQRRRGAEFLVVPATSLWWLTHYRELAEHLDRRYSRLVDDAETAVVFDLRRRKRRAEAAATARRSRRRPLAVTTIVSRNYLAQARVLARSLLEHEPDARFYLLVVDRLPPGVEAGAEVSLVDPDDLAIPGFYEMCFKYGVVELSTAVKPYLLAHLMREYGEERVAYLDPDILVMRPLDELHEALGRGPVVLTPHITRPIPVDGKRPNEQDILISGVFNLGFIALKRSADSEELLEWWQERLHDGCRIDVANGLFTDQKWVDLVPSLFPDTVVLRDPTYNVAFWNLHERSIARQGKGFLVNGCPAAFFHLSGYSPDRPRELSKHQNRVEPRPGSALAALLDRYGALLLDNGHREASTWDYGHDRFDDGSRVHPLLRQIYLNLDPEQRRRFGDPFVTGRPGSFLEWAVTPREAGELSLFLQTIYRVRYDLPLAFPDVRGRDRAAFLEWARRWGSVEMGFDPSLVRSEPASAPATAFTAPAGARATIAAPSAAARGRRDRAADAKAPKKRTLSVERYRALVERVRDVVRSTVPAGAKALVISRGDYRLLELGGAEGWHFPQTADGIYGGYHPPDSAVAVAHLEALRAKGASHLVIPQTSLWWLDHYEAFRKHLEERHELLVRDESACFVYALREPNDRRRAESSARTNGKARARSTAVATTVS